MVELTEFLSKGGQVKINPHQQTEIRIIHFTEIAPYSRNACYIAHIIDEGLEKLAFIKAQQNPEKEYYVNQFALSLNLFPINPVTHFGHDFCIYPLIENYQMCKDRIKLARYLAIIQNRYDEKVPEEIKTKFETHPGYINKYRTPAINDFKKYEQILRQAGVDSTKLLNLLDYWLQQQFNKTICHSDYKPANTFIIPNSLDIGILDLEDLCADTQTFDLARLLASSDRKQWNEIITAYSQERTADSRIIRTKTFFDYALYIANVFIYIAKNPETRFIQHIPVFLENLNYSINELSSVKIIA